jgi:hypothetical protein
LPPCPAAISCARDIPGLTTVSWISFVADETADENRPHPFERAPSGLLWSSWSVGADCEERAKLGWLDDPEDGSGAEPNPAYLPPCDGGRSAERFALALPIRSKNASFPLPPPTGDRDGASLYDGLPVRAGLKDDEEMAPPARDLRVA